MIKKKGKKSKATGKKPAKKKSGAKRKKKELNPAEARNEVSRIVEAHAGKLAAAVVEEGEKGRLPDVKYLFEVANIYPPAADGSQVSAREESLAETLLDRLGIPKDPVVADELAKEENVSPVEAEEEEEEEEETADEQKGAGSEQGIETVGP